MGIEVKLVDGQVVVTMPVGPNRTAETRFTLGEAAELSRKLAEVVNVESCQAKELQKGDMVNVFNTTPDGRIILEGKAQLVKYVDRDRWKVRFGHENRTFERFVELKNKL